MKVIDRLRIAGRGPLLTVTWDRDKLPSVGDRVRRTSPNAIGWPLRGVERWAIERSSWKGAPLGLLLPEGIDIDTGDDIDVTPPNESNGEG